MTDDSRQNDDFQQNPGEGNPMDDIRRDEKLPEDGDTPFSPPDGVQDRIDDTFQPTDTNVDAMERYDAGIEGAAGVDMPGQAADESDDPPEIE